MTLPLLCAIAKEGGKKRRREKEREKDQAKFQNSHSSIIPPSFPHFSVPVLGKMAAKGHHLPPPTHSREPSNILTRAVYRGLLERKTKRARTERETEGERERKRETLRDFEKIVVREKELLPLTCAQPIDSVGGRTRENKGEREREMKRRKGRRLDAKPKPFHRAILFADTHTFNEKDRFSESVIRIARATPPVLSRCPGG